MADGDTIFPLPKALLVALFLESILFGIFTVLYAISIWILIYRQQHSHRSKLNKRLLGTGTAMFVLAVIHIAFDIQRAMEGFITHGSTPADTAEYFQELNHPLFVGKSAIYITQTLVGDAFVTYRLYVVYNRNPWIAVLPLALLLGTGISGYGVPINVALGGPSQTIFSGHLVPWITSFFVLSLTTNVLATFLLSGRIMWSNYKVKQYHLGKRWSVLETIVQSAALYSAALISLLATYLASSNAQYVCLDALQPIIGITFTLIIIRVGLGETASKHSDLKTHRVAVDAASGPLQSHGHEQPYPLRPLAVNVSVSQTCDRESFEVYEQKKEVDTASNSRLDVNDVLGHGRKDSP
ncbi:hypothetical protein GSI_12077 [Ganoderma sinense ZZ0214-1]|uniref:Uncharacterized protein n=1 Tax=Ganoderma sinense ZZ0214-1 TaxID=1077348 RepID=A0A2G8RXS9_9APHY|nr:hypothetical protein GSI_12077 [Ganoderma sinense ZZ0214-1]